MATLAYFAFTLGTADKNKFRDGEGNLQSYLQTGLAYIIDENVVNKEYLLSLVKSGDKAVLESYLNTYAVNNGRDVYAIPISNGIAAAQSMVSAYVELVNNQATIYYLAFDGTSIANSTKVFISNSITSYSPGPTIRVVDIDTQSSVNTVSGHDWIGSAWYFIPEPPAKYDVYFNGTQLEHIYFNGIEIKKLYFNDTLIYPITTPHIQLGINGTTTESGYTWKNIDTDISMVKRTDVNIYTGIKLFDDDNVAANVQATIEITSLCGTTSRDGETHQVTTDSNGFAYFSTIFTTAQSQECGTYYINVHYGSKTVKNTITFISM